MPQVLLHKLFLKMKVWWRWGDYELSPAELLSVGHLLKGIAICPEKDGTPFQKLPIIPPLKDVRADWGFFISLLLLRKTPWAFSHCFHPWQKHATSSLFHAGPHNGHFLIDSQLDCLSFSLTIPILK